VNHDVALKPTTLWVRALALQLRILTVSDSLGHHDSAWGSWDGGSFNRDDAGVMGVIAA
jgi:hypothetical protein